jgi:hypothetical protein
MSICPVRKRALICADTEHTLIAMLAAFQQAI